MKNANVDTETNLANTFIWRFGNSKLRVTLLERTCIGLKNFIWLHKAFNLTNVQCEGLSDNCHVSQRTFDACMTWIKLNPSESVWSCWTNFIWIANKLNNTRKSLEKVSAIVPWSHHFPEPPVLHIRTIVVKGSVIITAQTCEWTGPIRPCVAKAAEFELWPYRWQTAQGESDSLTSKSLHV